MDSRRESILNSTRIEPDGEEEIPETHEIQSDDEFNYALKQHDAWWVIKTISKINFVPNFTLIMYTYLIYNI